MSHDERLEVCKEIQCKLSDTLVKHVDESGPVRMDVARHNIEITTLSKQHEGVMQDIKEIRLDIKEIREDLSDIRIWILRGVVAIVFTFITAFGVVFLYEASSNGSYRRQIEINTKRLDVIEGQHLNGVK